MGNYAKGNPFHMLVNNVVSFCLHPKNLSVFKLKKIQIAFIFRDVKMLEY